MYDPFFHLFKNLEFYQLLNSLIDFFKKMNVSVFSNLLKDTQSHILADSDEHEAVQQVQVIARFLLWLAPLSMMFRIGI